ncbi:trehalose-phosphatase [Desulfofundulus thermosubterraneus]|uniref:Trehalose 6-phosphate phosphatase n=1 Tax=Desulfofundulus thermosubterraneus DSM 16057 TaxID=1121432 RepID=A0A1M6KGV8_9FIRM|nr:trehalose-phosphatase [Desulfofundulus thermosubterraneus]SHJ58203.1 trehalose 6-phosphatase [Desulfofundulus thermosubterraneus DSM 16057]
MCKEPPLTTPEKLAAWMVTAPQLLLMLDYDGTLVPIAPSPDLAWPNQELLAVLKKLTLSPDRAVAVISGRKLAELHKLLPLTGLHLVGSHGAEIQEAGGKTYRLFENRKLEEDILTLERIARECVAGSSGFLVENKGISLALHYRLAEPELARGVLGSFIERAAPIMGKDRLELLPGKKVLEIRPREVNKGKAVQYLCRKHAGALPVYIGDDRTDEDAFMALGEGCGILISSQPRPSAATARLPSPREVYQMLLLLAP